MTQGGKLTIQTTKHNSNVKLIVKDTGVGIPKKDIAQLFTPLFTTKANGIGLGLLICKQLVEGHNGTITAKSKVGEGSEFIVELPIKAEKTITEQSVFNVSMVFKEGVQIEG
jgi:signal transduction histidine kinase